MREKARTVTEPAAPLALVVRFTVRVGAEDSFDTLVEQTVAGIRDHEPGTLIYTCHKVDSAPNQRVFYELYRDRAAFESHEQQPHTQHFLATREALLESTQVDFLSLADGKPFPYAANDV